MNTIKYITTICILTACLGASSTSSARTPTGQEIFGIGLQLGDPTAITAKLLPSEHFGFQAYIGGGGWANDLWGRMFITGLDVVFHPVMIYDGWKTCALNLTLGAGGALGLFRGWYYDGWNNYNDYRYDYLHDGRWYGCLYLRFVTGVNLWFKKFPLECFVELTPSIRLFRPDPVGFHMFWVGAGARWWF